MQATEKPKVNYWMVSTVILVILLVGMGVFILTRKESNKFEISEEKQMASPTKAVTSPELSPIPSQIQDDELFLVTALDRFRHKLILYNRDTQQLKEKTIDFSTTGFDMGLLDSRFAGTGATESVHYNPNTREIILVVRQIPGEIAGSKPPEALPEPPFSYAIYKTTFEDKVGLTQLFSSKEQIIPNNVILSDSKNLLIFGVKNYQGGKISSQDLFEFDLTKKSIRKLTTLQAANDGKEIVELSDLSISPQSDKIYQLVLYGTQGFWTNQRLELKLIDLNDGTIETKKVISGDGIVFSISGLSKDATKVVFYTTVNNERKLQLKNLVNGNLVPISPSEDIKNLDIFVSGDNNQILYGTDNGWTFLDLDTGRVHKTTITRPFV
jgi:hypothetical protein